MRTVAVAFLTALLIAACGSGGDHPGDAGAPVQRLCVVTSLPSRGPEAAAGRALLAGITAALRGGVSIGDANQLSLCDSLADAPGAGGQANATTVAANAGAAPVAAPTTVAYIGELSPANASVAAAVLREEGVPLITLAGPGGAPQPGSGPSTAVIYLGALASDQLAAERSVLDTFGCARQADRARPHCLLSEAPFCAGVGTTTLTTRRFCVGPGSALTGSTPARAYGYSAGQLLIAALRAVVSAGNNPADRQAVGRALLSLRTTDTPIGNVRVNHDGTVSPAAISLYEVAADGSLAFDQVLRSH